jgi:hypothetical protein
MCAGSPTVGTWSSSQWRPDDEFETDTLNALEVCYPGTDSAIVLLGAWTLHRFLCPCKEA